MHIYRRCEEEEMGMDDVQSDLKTLRKLYSILQIRGDAQHGLAHAHETLDENSRDVLKKLLDGATQQAWIQFHANRMGEKSAWAGLLPQAPAAPHTVTEKDEEVDPVGTSSISRNEMAADDCSTQSTTKELETPAGCAAPPPKPNHLHLNTHRKHPCPGLISTIRCKHHQHLLRRGLSTSTSCRSVKESAATETHENQKKKKKTTTIHIPPGRAMTLNPRTRPPTTTHEIPGRSRRKHMDSSLTSLAKDGSTKKMKEVKASKKPVGDDALSLKLKDEKKMKRRSSSSSQATALLLPLRKTDSIRRRVQKSRKPVGPTSQKKLHLLHDHHADSRSRKKDGNEEGDSRTAALMHHKRRRREGGRRTEQMKKVGATLESQRPVSRGGSRMSNSYMDYKHKKLPPRPRGTVDSQSQTRSSYTITESIDESASRTSSPSTLNQRMSEQPWMRKNSLIHYSRRKYYSSSSSSSSSSCWLVSRPASSLRSRPRVVREKPTDNRGGRLRRFKDKLAVIFHHHHHHYHLGSSGGDSEVESPTPAEVNPHRRGSMRKPSGAGSTSAAIRVPRHRHRHHGHLYTLLQRLLKHVWHSRMEEEGKTCSRLVGKGRNDWCVQQGAAGGGGGGGKQGSRKKKPAIGLGFYKAQRNKIQVS